jgi:hypothetical protein
MSGGAGLRMTVEVIADELIPPTRELPGAGAPGHLDRWIAAYPEVFGDLLATLEDRGVRALDDPGAAVAALAEADPGRFEIVATLIVLAYSSIEPVGAALGVDALEPSEARVPAGHLERLTANVAAPGGTR